MTLPKHALENYLNRPCPNCTIQKYGDIWNGVCECGYKFHLAYLIGYGNSWDYSQEFLDKVRSFKALYLHGNYLGKSPYKLNQLNHLHQLTLVSYKKFNFEFLKDFNNLEILELSELTIKDLHGIEQLKELKSLIISEMKKLEDIDALSSLKLRMLSFVTCNKIKDFSSIKNLTTLKDFQIETNSIDSIKFLSSLKQLEFININAKIVDKDLSPLYKLKKLKHFYTKKSNLSKAKKLELQMTLPNCKVEA